MGHFEDPGIRKAVRAVSQMSSQESPSLLLHAVDFGLWSQVFHGYVGIRKALKAQPRCSTAEPEVIVEATPLHSRVLVSQAAGPYHPSYDNIYVRQGEVTSEQRLVRSGVGKTRGWGILKTRSGPLLGPAGPRRRLAVYERVRTNSAAGGGNDTGGSHRTEKRLKKIRGPSGAIFAEQNSATLVPRENAREWPSTFSMTYPFCPAPPPRRASRRRSKTSKECVAGSWATTKGGGYGGGGGGVWGLSRNTEGSIQKVSCVCECTFWGYT